MASAVVNELEHELLALARRVGRLRVGVPGVSGAEIERSSYLILRLLAEEGPLRIGRISQVFDLDPSTVTRQVQTVVRLGLADRSVDDGDRRATILAISDLGRQVVAEAQERRRRWLDEVLGDWSEDDRSTLTRLLTRFNADAGSRSDRAAAGGPCGTAPAPQRST